MEDNSRNSAETDPQRVDVQDPLPENNWFWRRTYTFLLSIVSLAFIWFGAEGMYQMGDPEKLFQLTRYMIGILFFLILCYMVAPSAEQIVKLIQAAKILREGVTVTRKAVSDTPQGHVSVETTSGVPPAAETPPAALEEPEEQDYAPRSRT